MVMTGERMVRGTQFTLPKMRQPPDIGVSESTGELFVQGRRFPAQDAATALEAFKALGPGEKSTNTAIIPRGARRPVPTATEWPMYISSRWLETWLNNHDEIADIRLAVDGTSQFASYETGTTTERTTPSVPTSNLDPPYILCPKHIAFKPV